MSIILGEQTSQAGSGASIGTGECAGNAGAWGNPSNAIADNENFASRQLDTSQDNTACLRVSSFGFQIPWEARIRGIELYVDRKNTNTAEQMTDRFIKAGTTSSPTTPDKASSDLWPSEFGTYKIYGSPTDNWGIEDPAFVNTPNFAFWISGKRITHDFFIISAQVRHVFAKVYFETDVRDPTYEIPCELEVEDPDPREIGVGDPPEGYDTWDDYEDRLCRVAQMVIDHIIAAAMRFEDLALAGAAIIPLVIAVLFAGTGAGLLLAAPIAILGLIINALVAILRSSAYPGWHGRIAAVKQDLVCALFVARTVGEARVLVDIVIDTIYQPELSIERSFLKHTFNNTSLNRLYWSNLDIDIPAEYLETYCNSCDPPPIFGEFPLFDVTTCEFPDAIPDRWQTSSGTWGQEGGTSDARIINAGAVCGEPTFPSNITDYCTQCGWCIDGFLLGSASGQVKMVAWTPDADYILGYRAAVQTGLCTTAHLRVRIWENAELIPAGDHNGWLRQISRTNDGLSQCSDDTEKEYIKHGNPIEDPFVFREGITYAIEFQNENTCRWLVGDIVPELAT